MEKNEEGTKATEELASNTKASYSFYNHLHDASDSAIYENMDTESERLYESIKQVWLMFLI